MKKGIDITKLTYNHLGRRVVDANEWIGEIVGLTKNQILVHFPFKSEDLVFPEDLKFYDYPGGLTREDIGSHWKDHNGNICTFAGSDFSDMHNIEYLIFRGKDMKMWYTVKHFKSFTRVEEKGQTLLKGEVKPSERSVVWLTNYQTLADAIESGKKVHNATGDKVYSVRFDHDNKTVINYQIHPTWSAPILIKGPYAFYYYND